MWIFSFLVYVFQSPSPIFSIFTVSERLYLGQNGNIQLFNLEVRSIFVLKQGSFIKDDREKTENLSQPVRHLDGFVRILRSPKVRTSLMNDPPIQKPTIIIYTKKPANSNKKKVDPIFFPTYNLFFTASCFFLILYFAYFNRKKCVKEKAYSEMTSSVLSPFLLRQISYLNRQKHKQNSRFFVIFSVVSRHTQRFCSNFWLLFIAYLLRNAFLYFFGW